MRKQYQRQNTVDLIAAWGAAWEGSSPGAVIDCSAVGWKLSDRLFSPNHRPNLILATTLMSGSTLRVSRDSEPVSLMLPVVRAIIYL